MFDENILKSSRPGFVPALHECDRQTQFRTERLRTLTRAAKRVLLEPGPHSVLDGLALLDLIQEEAENLDNEINSIAEQNGASHYQADTSLKLEVHQSFRDLRREDNERDAMAVAERAKQRAAQPPSEGGAA